MSLIWMFVLLYAPGAEAQGQRTLVLGIRQGPVQSRRMGEAVVQRLARMGEAVVREIPASPSGCSEDPGCVVKLARDKGAALVVDGEVRPQGAEASYVVAVRLFDVKTRADIRHETAACNDCDAETLESMVAGLVGGLYEKPLVHGPAQQRSLQAGFVARSAGGSAGYWRPWRIASVGITTTLFAASLVAAAVFTAYDGRHPGGDSALTYRFKDSYELYYGLAGAAAAGMIVSFAIPSGTRER